MPPYGGAVLHNFAQQNKLQNMGRTRDIDFDEGADSRRFVTALARGLELLSAFSVDETWLTSTELARRTGLPKPTIARLAYTLCVLGYLRHSRQSGRYALGDGVAALGITMVSNLRLRRIARPYMQDLADRYDISVSLGIRHGLDVLYLENCRSGTPLSLGLDIGSRLPIAVTAMGHALLSVLEPAERERLLAELRRAAGADWPRQQPAIEAGCAHGQARGFTVVVRDWQSDIAGVGAAIRQPDGRVVAFNAGGSASKFPRELLEQEIGPQLARMVKGLASFVRSEEP